MKAQEIHWPGTWGGQTGGVRQYRSGTGLRVSEGQIGRDWYADANLLPIYYHMCGHGTTDS